MRRPFGPARLGGDQFCSQLIGKARHDLILHVKEISHRVVETFGPEVNTSFAINELDIDAHAVAAPLHRTLKDIANAEFLAEALQIDMFSLISESGVATDHETTDHARQIRRQALGDTIDKMLLFRIATDIGEGQHDDGKARDQKRTGYYAAQCFRTRPIRDH